MTDVVTIRRESEVILVEGQPGTVIVTQQEAAAAIVIQRDGIPGRDGADGAAGGTTYQHNQASASTSWAIPHNLGRFPSVTIVDNAGREVIGDVTFHDLNFITIDFDIPMSGTAYLN